MTETFAMVLDASTSPIPTLPLILDPSPFAFLGLVAFAAMVGTLLGITMRRLSKPRRTVAAGGAIASPVAKKLVEEFLIPAAVIAGGGIAKLVAAE